MSGTKVGKQQLILDAAVSCFGRLGYQHTSMDTIARGAGMSRSALYQYFDNKEDVFRTMTACMVDELVAQAQAAGTAGATVSDRLYAVLAVRLDLVAGRSEREFRAELLEQAASIASDLLLDGEKSLRKVVADVLDDSTGNLDLLGTVLSTKDTAAILVDALSGIEKSSAPLAQLRTRLRQLVDLAVRGLQTGAPQ